MNFLSLVDTSNKINNANASINMYFIISKNSSTTCGGIYFSPRNAKKPIVTINKIAPAKYPKP